MFLQDFFDAMQALLAGLSGWFAWLAVAIPNAVAAFLGQLGI